MFLIGICDDSEEEREYIKQMCERCFTELGQTCEYRYFTSGEEVLSYSGQPMHLLFLYAGSEREEGFGALRRLERSELIWRIAVISSDKESVFESLGVRTLGFGIKPVDYGMIRQWLSVTVRENWRHAQVRFATPEGQRLIEAGSLSYLEAAGNYVYVHASRETFLADGNLKLWEERLGGMAILRVHRSYLVNLAAVRELSGDAVILTDGGRLPIGRQYKADVREAYQRFLGCFAQT
ncbi:MAG: response regulator transcription factor [Lachnospiraceae bacterium]|nr:response regulator transcription factor [Lachnospiraceae bacterium]